MLWYASRWSLASLCQLSQHLLPSVLHLAQQKVDTLEMSLLQNLICFLCPEAEVDYEAVEETLLFDGNTFEDMVCIEISIIDDVFFEPTEQFSVSLINSGPNVILNEDMNSSIIYITSTLTLPGERYIHALKDTV